jgi:hypothetical protein
MSILRRLLCWLLLAGLAAGCLPAPTASPGPPVWTGEVKATLTPFQPLPPEVLEVTLKPPPTVSASTLQPSATQVPAQPTSEPVQTPEGRLLWVHPALPQALRERLVPPADFILFEGAGPPAGEYVQLEIGAGQPISRWVYAAVTPFPSKVEGVVLDDLRQSWAGESRGPFAGKPLLVSPETMAVFSAWWGEPAPQSVQVVPAENLAAAAWDSRPAWAVVPFEALEPRWKVLAVDGASPLDLDFSLPDYPLTVPLSIAGPEQLVAAALQSEIAVLPGSNRQEEHLTTLALTGVTALVRATAFAMERQGVLYPGKDVRDLLRGADFTHISNEVPFAKNCPFPNPNQESLIFCSDPRYIELLEDVGADIIELTGDHFQDWGQQAMYDTLDLYKEKGWSYYGGGANLAEGRQALLVEHNGNRLAFIGCNAKGGGFAQARENAPGAVTCDFPFMEAEIARLRAEGYMPVATFQHYEYYTYQAQANQKADSRRLAEAGAVIVSGSQAHQPQGMEFWGETFIHYGLGNLFFDQYNISYACRQAFIDLHVFYEGRYLGVQLHPILFIDYARPRPMTDAERDELLEAVFTASGW